VRSLQFRTAIGRIDCFFIFSPYFIKQLQMAWLLRTFLSGSAGLGDQFNSTV
jgi:hypothetical protein